ncbi:MAG: FtsQ-type POTRA domain-containing protein [Chloroflexia bacterium]|nr:FtsQ-type POTRA domain-containing protein [Chloroflexia bacterium]
MERSRRGPHRATNWFAVLTRTGRLPSLLVAIACAIVLYGFLFSGDYGVDDVVVKGARLGDPVEIASATGALGDSVFEVEPETIAQRLTALPYIQQVDIETHWPSRIVVNVTERIPVIVWQTEEGRFLIDAYGQVLTIVGSSVDLPIVESEAVEVEVGGQIDPQWVASVRTVYDSLGTQLDRVIWSDREGLTARLDDKSIVMFGYPDRIPLKIAVYQEVGTTPMVWSVLDLREPDRPFYE